MTDPEDLDQPESGGESHAAASSDLPLIEEARIDPGAQSSPSAAATTERGAIGRPKAQLLQRSWRRIATVAAAVVSVIGVLWTFYEIKEEFFPDASGYSTLRLTANAYPETATEWAIPVDTDLSGFPSSSGGCGEKQETWLSANGERVTTRVMLDMRNTASEGAMIVVKDVALVGERQSDSVAQLLVMCDAVPTSSTVIRAARLDATSESGVATLAANTFGATSKGLPDAPVVWNLAPGETGQLLIRISSRVETEGSLAAAVLSGESARVVDVDGTRIRVVPLLDDGSTWLDAGADLRCLTEADGELLECNILDVLSAGGSEDGGG